MATTSTFRADHASLRYYGRIADTATLRRFMAKNTLLWFQATGQELKLLNNCSGTGGFEASIDGGAWATVTTSSGTNGLSSAIALGDGVDETHDVRIRARNAYSGGNAQLVLVDGIQVTGDAPAIAAHSAAGAYELCCSTTFKNLGVAAVFEEDPDNDFYSTPGVWDNEAWSIGTVRRKIQCGDLYVWTKFDGRKIRLTTDGVPAASAVTVPTVSGSWGFVQVGTGLDSTAEHEYEVVNCSQVDALLAVGTLSASAVPAREKVYYLGDSITNADQGTSSNQSFGFAYVGGVGLVDSYNRGVDGNTTAQMTARVTDVASDADVVVILAGRNDYVLAQTNPETFQANYVDLISAVMAQATSAKILCLGVLRTSSTDATILAAQNALIAAAVSGMEDSRVVYVSTASLGVVETSDGTHPTAAGHAVVAAFVRDYIACAITAAAPTFASASVASNGLSVDVLLNSGGLVTATGAPNGFFLIVNGNTLTTTNTIVSHNYTTGRSTVRLAVAEADAIRHGDTVTLTGEATDVTDVLGRALVEFYNESVTNDVPGAATGVASCCPGFAFGYGVI